MQGRMKILRKLVVTTMTVTLMLTGVAGCGNTKGNIEDEMATEEDIGISDIEVTTETKEEKPKDTEVEIEITTETEEVVDSDENAIELYKQYIGMNTDKTITAVVEEGVSIGYSDYEKNYVGQELSFDNIYEILIHDSHQDINPSKFYQILNIGGKNLLLLQYGSMDIYEQNDQSTSTFVISEKDGKLYITHSFDEWGRGGGRIYDTGEYSDAKVHPFRKFRAPFSGKAEHTFPE